MKFSILPVVLLLAGAVLAQEAKPAAPSPAAPAAQAAPSPEKPGDKPADQPKSEVIAQASDRPDSGRVADDTYTSDYFGFTLALPAGWKVDDREALQKSVDES